MKPIAVGQVFGKLEVVSLSTSTKTPKKGKPSRAHVACRCNLCGKTRTVVRSSLFAGKAKTCGEKECTRQYLSSVVRTSGFGGQRLASSGHLRVYRDRKYVFVHRLVMENHLGRKLKKSEVVHHLNGIKTDNRIENLEVLSSSAHTKKHSERLREIASLKKRVEELEARVMRLEHERSRLVLAS